MALIERQAQRCYRRRSPDPRPAIPLPASDPRRLLTRATPLPSAAPTPITSIVTMCPVGPPRATIKPPTFPVSSQATSANDPRVPDIGFEFLLSNRKSQAGSIPGPSARASLEVFGMEIADDEGHRDIVRPSPGSGAASGVRQDAKRGPLVWRADWNPIFHSSASQR